MPSALLHQTHDAAYHAYHDEQAAQYGRQTTGVCSDELNGHGPSLWIEFSLQSNKSTDKVGNHPHSVWRDRTDN